MEFIHKGRKSLLKGIKSSIDLSEAFKTSRALNDQFAKFVSRNHAKKPMLFCLVQIFKDFISLV